MTLGRRRNLWPLPGGVNRYAPLLRALLRAAYGGDGRAAMTELLRAECNVTSTSAVRGYIGVPVTLGLLLRDRATHQLSLSTAGVRFADTGDLEVVRNALIRNVLGIAELLEALGGGSKTCAGLSRELARVGIAWENPMAVRYRVWWLTAAEAIAPDRVSRSDFLRITAAGCRTHKTAITEERSSSRAAPSVASPRSR